MLQDSTEKPIITISNLCFNYSHSQKMILNGISIDIKHGESVVILGENGSGKSTLFFCLLNLLKKTKGSIKIFDQEINHKNIKDIRKKIGFLFQDSTHQLFLPRVKEEVAFAPYNLGLRNDELEARIQKTLSDLGLQQYYDKSTMQLSYGEKKQIAFATIYAMEPDLYILDEPFISLDPHNRSLLIEIMQTIQSKGKTILLVSHELDQIPSFFQRVIVLHQGQIIFDGSINQLFQTPDILSQANLSVPLISQLYCKLKKDGLISKDFEFPTNLTSAIQIFTEILRDSKEKS